MTNYLIEILAPPIDSGRALQRMNLYLWVTVGVLLVTFSTIFLVNEAMTTRLVSVVIIAFCMGAIGFLYRGKTTFARIAFPLVLYCVISFLILMGFGVYSQSIPGVIALLIFAALLGGRRVMVGYVALSMLTIVVAYLMEQMGYIDNGMISPSVTADLINSLIPVSSSGIALWFLIRYIEADRDLAKESAKKLEVLNTELNEQRDDLNRTESQYRLLANNASDFIWTADMSLNYTFCSPASERVIGYSADALLGKSVFEHLEPDLMATFGTLFEEELRQEELHPDLGRFQKLEFKFQKPDGTEIDAESSVSFLRDDDKNVIGVVGSTRDITERLSMEEEHREVTQQLLQSQKIESIGQLAGGIAHDFNNLLVAIQGYIDLIHETESNPDTVLYADEIKKASDRAANLTRQLLIFSRRQVMQRAPINLNELVGGLLNMLSRLIREDIRIDFAPGEGLYTIAGDAGQLEQVLVNLCLNARDAMPDGGVIKVATGNVVVTPNMIVGNAAVPGQYVELTVSDTGLGMDEALVEKIFEPFFSTKEKGKGTGLGLSVVHGVLMEHGGLINVSSKTGVGSTFSMCLPKSDIANSTSTLVNSANNVTGSGELILLVEDDEQVRDLVTLALKQADYKVIEASDGSLGLHMFRAHSDEIRLVLSDVIMPEMGGRELMEAIHASDESVPFVFITGYADEPDFVEDSDLDFVQKPFSATELIETVQRAIDKQSTRV